MRFFYYSSSSVFLSFFSSSAFCLSASKNFSNSASSSSSGVRGRFPSSCSEVSSSVSSSSSSDTSSSLSSSARQALLRFLHQCRQHFHWRRSQCRSRHRLFRQGLLLLPRFHHRFQQALHFHQQPQLLRFRS